MVLLFGAETLRCCLKCLPPYLSLSGNTLSPVLCMSLCLSAFVSSLIDFTLHVLDTGDVRSKHLGQHVQNSY